jgi:hypothetical protein
MVEPEGVDDDDQLKDWIRRALGSKREIIYQFMG